MSSAARSACLEISSLSTLTWSVRGTGLALCTKSSSLSMSTRTSINGHLRGASGPRSVGRVDIFSHIPFSSAPQLFLQAYGHLVGDEIVDPSPERRKLLDAAG